MKTKFYQSTRPSNKKVTNLDLAKGFGYLLVAFIVAVGGVLAIVILANGCESLSNLLK